MISDMVYFKHKYITMPIITTADQVIKAARELVHTLQRTSPSTVAATNHTPLKKLVDIFDAIVHKKVPNEKWNTPIVSRVLQTATSLRVPITVQERTVTAPEEELIVASTNTNVDYAAPY